ncbi:OmpA family protein [Marinivivus vitaminiproducens]|uniref:OmpA family protein n=1 Tax=Marinivivus vitaminiproducens TaxID=3035935 RepID=UPI00279A5F6F|nr:OmpA family protein [Geminicoccaceae bacterium SCSIO 64248]
MTPAATKRPALRRLLATAAIALIPACTAISPESETALGSPFNEELKQGYLQLASGEAWPPSTANSSHFRGKAYSALLAEPVGPDRVGDREIEGAERDEALALRERLLADLEAGAREQKPIDAARAQWSYDCWLRQVEIDPASATAEACKATLTAALAEIDDLAPVLPDIPPATVYFSTGSASLTAAANDAVRDFASDAGVAPITVIGHTDSTGSASANQSLSQRRADAVADALRDMGATGPITVTSVGSAEPERAVSGPEASNRRVEMRVGG